MSENGKVLFHKCKLSQRAITDLRRLGIVPVKVDNLMDVQFLEAEPAPIVGSEFLWACLDVLGDASRDIPETRKKFCVNLRKLMEKHKPKKQIA